MDAIFKYIETSICERYAELYQQPYFVSIGYFKDFDFASIGKKKFEVKFDCKSITTGNFAVEVSYKGHPSGLTDTKADYIIFSYPDGLKINCFEVETNTLRMVVEKYRIITGGDGNNSAMKLIPVEVIKSISSDKFTVDLELPEAYWLENCKLKNT